MSSYQLLALDLDGTLTNSNKEISQRNKEALFEAQRNGMKIVLASGRPTFGIEFLARELELQRYGGFIIAFNGSKIINCQTGEIIYQTDLPNHLIPKVYEMANEHDVAILSYNDTHILTERNGDEYIKYEAYLNRAPLKQVKNLLEAIPPTIPKILIVGDVPKIESLEKKMYIELGSQINVFRSEPFFLELVPKSVDKALSLERLGRYLGITAREMIACGDGFNDLSMIKYAGLGVAMANAQDVVKQASDYITLSNNEDGVAHVVEKFIISKN